MPYICLVCISVILYLFQIPCRKSLFHHRINVTRITAIAVVIQTISYDKVIGNLQTSVFNIKIHLQITWFHQQRAHVYRLGIMPFQRLYHMYHRQAGIHNILDNHHRSACDIAVQSDNFLNGSRRRHTFVGGQFHKRYLAGQRHFTQQVGRKNKRAVQNGQKYRFFTCQITIYLGGNSLHLFQYLRFRQRHNKRSILYLNCPHGMILQKLMQRYAFFGNGQYKQDVFGSFPPIRNNLFCTTGKFPYICNMKVLTAGQCKALDRYTIEHEPIDSLDLMERASAAIAREISIRWDSSHPLIIFAGPGNNGGDALAVARLLGQEGYRSQVFLFNVTGKLSPDCLANKERLADCPNVNLTEVTSQFSFPLIHSENILIDGLFGTGLNKPLNGGFASVTQQINASGAPVVSIDIPSGLMCEDNTYNYMSHVVKASLTLTLQVLKPAFLFAENQRYLGEIKILDIGLIEKGLNPEDTYIHITEHEEIRRMILPRDPFAHKGMMGHGLLVSGQYGMAGAAILAARACLRSGAGKLTVHTPRLNLPILQAAVPEAIVHTDPDSEIITQATDLRPYRAIAIGPGLGTDEETADAFHEYLMQIQCPLILDADALNLLGLYREWIQDIPAGSILTPHPKELEQLTGQCTNGYERMEKAREMATLFQLYVIVKGRNTLICMPNGHIVCNPTGNAGMATAGSGDVLTGILLGLLTRGYTPEQAAQFGVYLHGLAGDIAAGHIGEESMMAGDIIDAIPLAFKNIQSN